MDRNDILRQLHQDLGYLYNYVGPYIVDRAVGMAMEAIAPLGEQGVASATSNGGHVYPLNTTSVYYVESVYSEPSTAGRATNLVPVKEWSYDHQQGVVTLFQPVPAGNTIWFVYRSRYDWSAPTWVPDKLTVTGVRTFSKNTPQGRYGLASPFTVSEPTNIYGVAFYLACTTTVSEGSDLPIYLNITGPGENPNAGMRALRMYPEPAASFYPWYPIRHTVEFDPPVAVGANGDPEEPWWFWLDWDQFTSPSAKPIGGGDGVCVVGTTSVGGGTSSMLYTAPDYGWVTCSFRWPFQYKTNVEQIEVDPEFVRLYALHLVYMELGSSMKRSDFVGLADRYLQRAEYRRSILLRHRQMEDLVGKEVPRLSS